MQLPSFVEIGHPVLEKKIFEVFFAIYGRGGHLGHVTQMPRTNFRPLPIDGYTISSHMSLWLR